MTKFEDIINLLDMNEVVDIYVSFCADSTMAFHGTLRDMPIETFLSIKGMNVSRMYTSVEENDKAIGSSACLNIMLDFV